MSRLIRLIVFWLLTAVVAASGRAVAVPKKEDEARAVSILKAAGAKVVEINSEEDGIGIAVDFIRPISNRALEPIKGLTRLVGLRILGGGVTDEGLKYIDEVPNLRTLVISSNTVTDKGLEYVGKLTSLVKLDFIHARITEKGLAYLKNLKNLRRFYLYSTKIRDDDIKPLETMTNLKLLYLPPTVSECAAAALQEKLPEVKVKR